MADDPTQEAKEARQEAVLFRNTWTRVTIVLAALLAVLFVVLFSFGLLWYLSPIVDSKPGLSITQRKDLVQGLASVVQALAVLFTGTVGLVGLFFTWRNLRQTRESTQRTLELTEQGQITERFTRAIDQFGAADDERNPRLEIRLGGIYALERIDKESPERTYHGTVMEVLTAYVRENSRRLTKSSKLLEGDSESDSRSNEAAAKAEEGAKPPAPAGPRLPTADVQAILDVLRRAQTRLPEKYRTRLDLHKAHLGGADLNEANLYRAYLQQAYLHRANLKEANLQGANLQQADLEAAHLEGAHLEGAHLLAADLEGAHLQGANLQGADLRAANLKGANLLNAVVTAEQLAATSSLRGATMSDGSEHS